MAKNTDSLAFLKYTGELVNDGYLDAKKSADVLYGLDKTLRYFLYQEDTNIQNIEFEIPVKIQEGSWEALIPESIEKILVLVGTVSAGAYGKKALEKMAEHDFKDIGFKTLFQKAFKSIVWVIKIAKHYKTMHKREFREVGFRDNNKIAILRNEDFEDMEVPIEYLQKYVDCPEMLFSQITKIIETERNLEIGVSEPNSTDKTIVKITIREKQIFYKKNEEEDILFPELKDGDYVELEGHVTRGNENTNTIGFFYKDHVITCYPENGYVENFKSQLFSDCLMKGYVDRTTKDGKFSDKRPRIKFIELILMDRPYPDLFSNF